jgi:hypothetical protein
MLYKDLDWANSDYLEAVYLYVYNNIHYSKYM